MVLYSFRTYHLVRSKSNTVSATIGAGTAYSSEEHEFTSSFSGFLVAPSLIVFIAFCILLFVILLGFCSFCHVIVHPSLRRV